MRQLLSMHLQHNSHYVVVHGFFYANEQGGDWMTMAKERLELFTHNKRAYEAAVLLMEETGKAAVIHPTGTGKSFIAFKLAEEHPDSRVLWLAPSEYIFKTQVENMRKVLCGSEAEKDETVQLLTANITFLTYTKLMMNEDSIGSLQPEYIVLDEFHRCGAPEWGSSVQKLIAAYPKAMLLGLSATNIRYLDNQRNMAEELFDGCIASEMTLGEAIAREILPAPTYVLSMYSYQEELKHLAKRVESERNQASKKENQRLLEELRRTLEQAEGLEQVFARHMRKKGGKYLVFCASKEHMADMVERSKEWFRLVDKAPHLYAVYYDNPESSKAFADFKADESDHLRLLFCIDMLNEGVHVENIDGVILLRPTISPILYLQQIGRALNTGKELKKEPIIFDIVNNFDSLYTVDALKAEFEDAITLIPGTRQEKGKFRERFRIVDELRDCRNLFAQLTNNLSASWDIYYAQAKIYYEANGNLAVNKSYVTASGLNLGSWLMTQRRVYAGTVAGNLSKEQIERLNAIGMVWEGANEQKFQTGVAELEKYEALFGHTDVPADYVTDSGYPLGQWIGNTRAAYKRKKLESDKIERLEAAGMIWDARTYRWEQNYKAAKKYLAEYGHLQVPSSYVTEEGLHLGRWLSNQIKAHNGTKSKAAALTAEQENKLESLGIVWKNKYEDGWDTRFALAKAYYEQHGNLELPLNYTIEGINLDKWVRNIRLKRNNPESSNLVLTEERISQMDAIGMRWGNKRKPASTDRRAIAQKKQERMGVELDSAILRTGNK